MPHATSHHTDGHALHAALDDAPNPNPPTHTSHPEPHIDNDPDLTWSESFVNADARASDIDSLERAMMSFTLTPDAYAYDSKLLTYDVNTTPSPYTTKTVGRQRALQLVLNSAQIVVGNARGPIATQ